MAFTDLNTTNGWIQEETASDVTQAVLRNSAVEAVGRKIPMATNAINVPNFVLSDVDLVAEGGTIPLKDPTLGEDVMVAYKWANRFAQSVEDEQDSILNFFDTSKTQWFSQWAIKFDNSALGTTAAANGTTVPFTSVYKLATDASNVTATAGALTYEDVNDAFAELENGNYYDPSDLVVIAHPSLQGALRNLKDAAGDRVVSEPLGGVPTLFGNQLVLSNGARTSATATSAPAGNPLLIVGSRKHLLVGVRSGPEFEVSNAPQWETDVIEMKTRVRRGFKATVADAFRVIEITAA